MTDLKMSLFKHTDKELTLGPGHHGVFVIKGEIKLTDQTVGQGEGHYLDGAQSPVLNIEAGVEVLHVCVSHSSTLDDLGPVLSEAVLDLDEGAKVFRLDQVSFPIGSCAYRHVHHGAGFRYLKEGALEITSDHGSEIIQTGEAWFEPAHSPVRATPQNDEPASFVRAMIIPQSFKGKPTIKYLNADDEARPKLQTTKRFFDQDISL